MYQMYMRKSKQTPSTVRLGDTGGFGHWIGSPDASNVLIWYHGGGFALPANRGYFKFFAKTLADAKQSNKSLSIFCLSYTLAPHAQYPVQLRQAVEALRHVLKSHRPDQILLGGDSAGGNLVAGVLSHVAHTHPEIEPLSLQKETQLKGALLLSPWTYLEADFSEMKIDAMGDILTEYVAGPWSSGYLGPAQRDCFTDLSTASTEWFAAFPVDRILVCAGGTEIMFPILEDLVRRWREAREIETVVGERECHVAPIYHLYMGENRETQQGKRIQTWLRECL